MHGGPAYRVETPRCVLRCFEPNDARALHEVVLANRDHLARRLEWARDEPLTLAERVEVLRVFRRRFDADEDYAYGLFDATNRALMGSVGLHPIPSEPTAATIGYWIARQHGGRGLATEAVAAIVRCAFDVLRVTRVEVHCDASNASSRALALRLGFRLDAELRDRGHAPGEARAVLSMFAVEFPESPAAGFAATAYDAIGGVLFEPDSPPRAPLR